MAFFTPMLRCSNDQPHKVVFFVVSYVFPETPCGRWGGGSVTAKGSHADGRNSGADVCGCGGQANGAASGAEAAAALEAIARQTEPLWAMLSDTIGRIEAGLATVAPHWDAAAASRVLPPGAAQVRCAGNPNPDSSSVPAWPH